MVAVTMLYMLKQLKLYIGTLWRSSAPSRAHRTLSNDATYV